MDTARRIKLLKQQIEEANGGDPADFNAWKERTAATLRVALGADHPATASFLEVRYSLGMYTSETPKSAFAAATKRGVLRGIAILEGAVHEVVTSDPVEASVSAKGFHNWVAGAITGLWDDGHHRQAVDEATRAIELRLKAKVGIDLSGTPLVTEAFNPAPPKEGQRRLRFVEFEEGTRAWTDAHQGAMNFGQGCMLRIRNLIEHHEGAVDEQIALESLAALSLLARWIDEADVIAL